MPNQMLFDLLRFWWKPCQKYAYDVFNHIMDTQSRSTLILLRDSLIRKVGMQTLEDHYGEELDA
jgi:hypothetical protein